MPRFIICFFNDLETSRDEQLIIAENFLILRFVDQESYERSEFEVDKTLSSVSSKLRTINEATDGRPNCVVFISYSSEGILRDPRNGLYVTGIGLCSLRAISADEELTISYGNRFQYPDLTRQTSQHFVACKVGKYIGIREDRDNAHWVIDTLADCLCTSSSADLNVLTTVLDVSLKKKRKRNSLEKPLKT